LDRVRIRSLCLSCWRAAGTAVAFCGNVKVMTAFRVG
jgi:hypothetical protein